MIYRRYMMTLTVHDQALAWFKEEVLSDDMNHIRLFAKYGGETNKHVNMSVGIQVARPEHPYRSYHIDGIDFYIEDVDAWFFNDDIIYIDYNPKLKEPVYIFE